MPSEGAGSLLATQGAPVMPRLFADVDVQERFDRHGFVVVPFLSEPELDSLWELYRSLELPVGELLHVTLMLDDGSLRHQVSEEVIARLVGPLRRHITDPQPIVGLFFVKPPTLQSEFEVHRDWTMVDENIAMTAKVWCPLTRTDVSNGTLHVMPGSHRLGPTWRGKNVPKEIMGLERQIAREHLIPVPCERGEAIIFDNRVIHWSPANESGVIRPVAALYVSPPGAELFHYFVDGAGCLRRKRVGREFFEDMTVGDVTSEEMDGSVKVPALLPRFRLEHLPRRGPERLAEPVVTP